MLNRTDLGQSGQSTVEFALTMILISAFMFLFFQLSMLMGYGSYVQYATFMASRAYLAAGPSKEDQVNRARTVLQQMLKSSGDPSKDRLPTIAKAEGGDGITFDDPVNFKAGDRNYSWLQGIRYSFKGRVFLLPIGKGGVSGKNPAALLDLTSESYLGREMTHEDCEAEMSSRGGGIYDNGC